MDDRENQEFYSILLTKIVDIIDQASSKDCFFIAVALSKNIIAPGAFPKDLFYNLYLTTVQYIDQYNLSDLSYFLMLFCTPIASKLFYFQYNLGEKIPIEFWEKVVEPQLKQALEDFKTYKDDLNIELFLDDYMRCLMGIAMAEYSSEDLMRESTEVMMDNFLELNNHTIENFIYSLTRMRNQDQDLWVKITNEVVKRKLIVDDKINEF